VKELGNLYDHIKDKYPDFIKDIDELIEKIDRKNPDLKDLSDFVKGDPAIYEQLAKKSQQFSQLNEIGKAHGVELKQAVQKEPAEPSVDRRKADSTGQVAFERRKVVLPSFLSKRAIQEKLPKINIIPIISIISPETVIKTDAESVKKGPKK